MQAIQLQSHIGNDGILKIQLPKNFYNMDLNVTLTIEPLSEEVIAKFEEKLSWHKFIEQTYGCMADSPIKRGGQGQYEIREVLQ